jgi:hypothetical protein
MHNAPSFDPHQVSPQFVLPAVRNATGWDVLVGHYLGVDHAGHTDDVFAPAMTAKLAQMDEQLAQVRGRRAPSYLGHCLNRTVDPDDSAPTFLQKGVSC